MLLVLLPLPRLLNHHQHFHVQSGHQQQQQLKDRHLDPLWVMIQHL